MHETMEHLPELADAGGFVVVCAAFLLVLKYLLSSYIPKLHDDAKLDRDAFADRQDALTVSFKDALTSIAASHERVCQGFIEEQKHWQDAIKDLKTSVDKATDRIDTLIANQP